MKGAKWNQYHAANVLATIQPVRVVSIKEKKEGRRMNPEAVKYNAILTDLFLMIQKAIKLSLEIHIDNEPRMTPTSKYCPIIIGSLTKSTGQEVVKIAIGDDKQATLYFDAQEIPTSKFCHLFNDHINPFLKKNGLEIDSLVDLS